MNREHTANTEVPNLKNRNEPNAQPHSGNGKNSTWVLTGDKYKSAKREISNDLQPSKRIDPKRKIEVEEDGIAERKARRFPPILQSSLRNLRCESKQGGGSRPGTRNKEASEQQRTIEEKENRSQKKLEDEMDLNWEIEEDAPNPTKRLKVEKRIVEIDLSEDSGDLVPFKKRFEQDNGGNKLGTKRSGGFQDGHLFSKVMPNLVIPKGFEDKQSFASRFKVLESIGEGGSCFVRKVACRKERKIFAVKSCKSNDSGSKALLEKEYKVLSMLSHPNIIRTYGVFYSPSNVLCW